jgi:hypothetical protein
MSYLSPIVLKTDSELKEFQGHVKREINIEFPLQYLKQGFVRAFKNSKGKMVGGYALILKGPFRTLDSIESNKTVNSLNHSETMEVTALWLDRSLRSGIASVCFWLRFSRDASTQPGKKYCVYAYDLDNEKLKRLYSLASPTVLYRGETKKLEGMKSSGKESIEVAWCRFIGRLPLYGFPSFILKSFSRKSTFYFRYAKAKRIEIPIIIHDFTPDNESSISHSQPT